jgi:microcystin-dependent protein
VTSGYQHNPTPTSAGGPPSGNAGGELAGTYPNPTVAATHSGSAHVSLPAGMIHAYGGTVAPSGYLLCDGTSYLRTTYASLFTAIGTRYGTVDATHFTVPDLRSSFPKGQAAAVDAVSTGGAATHAHSDNLTHSVTQPNAHVVTQPSAHSNHVVTQPAGHVFTQPAAHSNHVFTQPAAHSNHVFTQPSAHAALATHAHDLPWQIPSTTTIRQIAVATYGTGATQTATAVSAAGTANTTAAAVAKSQAVSGGTPDAHAGGAVDAHSAHASGAVDAHSAHASGAVDAHSATAVDAHSAHSSTAVDAHAGTAVTAHTAHAAVNSEPVYQTVNYIIKT